MTVRFASQSDDGDGGAQPAVETVALFAFQIGATTLAVDVGAVTSIVEVQPAVPAPRTPPHIKGFAIVGDRAVVVLDPAVLFGLDRTKDAERRLVIVRAAGMQAALDVDRAVGVVRVAADGVRPPRAIGGDRLLAVLAGEIDDGSGVVGVVDVARLFGVAKVRRT